MLTSLRLVIGGLALSVAIALISPAWAANKIKVTWIAHATFEIVSPGGTTLLFDPFITKNPKVPDALRDLSRYQPDAILVTHSHFDHTADLMPIAKATGAKVVGASDHIRGMELEEGQGLRGNPGGKVTVGDVVIHFVPAMHSSTPGGRPVGFVLGFTDGRTLYNTGDTGIFGDMSLIQELHQPNIILLQAGGGPFNQDPKAAALAIRKFFEPDVIVPMHYGTFGILASEDDVRKELGGDNRVIFMKPGETVEF